MEVGGDQEEGDGWLALRVPSSALDCSLARISFPLPKPLPLPKESERATEVRSKGGKKKKKPTAFSQEGVAEGGAHR